MGALIPWGVPLYQADDDCDRSGLGRAQLQCIPVFHRRRSRRSILSQGFSPTSLYVDEEFVRAVRGGIGFIKAAGNYAASLLASK